MKWNLHISVQVVVWLHSCLLGELMMKKQARLKRWIHRCRGMVTSSGSCLASYRQQVAAGSFCQEAQLKGSCPAPAPYKAWVFADKVRVHCLLFNFEAKLQFRSRQHWTGWQLHNCKPPVGRGADGVDAMA
jgi:hypothetical protein